MQSRGKSPVPKAKTGIFGLFKWMITIVIIKN